MHQTQDDGHYCKPLLHHQPMLQLRFLNFEVHASACGDTETGLFLKMGLLTSQGWWMILKSSLGNGGLVDCYEAW
ncbi:hypothetical protein A2U01_0030881, partial [Trifolium medium]|nr:hypothetical protein [Trifolium medium]